MAEESWLDTVAKDLARGRSRRDVLRGLGIAFGAVALGAFGPRAAHASPDCTDYCKGRGLTGRELGECISECQQTGGPPAACIPCGTNCCDPATEYCCNESCGICAPLGGFCIQIICP